jgi:hypothetical protein
MALNIEVCTNFTDDNGETSQYQIAEGNGAYYIVDALNRVTGGYPEVVVELNRDRVTAVVKKVEATEEQSSSAPVPSKPDWKEVSRQVEAQFGKKR